jgi:hypothetical protein
MLQDQTIFIIKILLAAIFVFIITRELICWYYKINKRIELQEKMLETLLKIYEQNGGEVDWDLYTKKDSGEKLE